MVKNCNTQFVVGTTHITAYAGNGTHIGTIACRDCLKKLKSAILKAEREWKKDETERS